MQLKAIVPSSAEMNGTLYSSTDDSVVVNLGHRPAKSRLKFDLVSWDMTQTCADLMCVLYELAQCDAIEFDLACSFGVRVPLAV